MDIAAQHVEDENQTPRTLSEWVRNTFSNAITEVFWAALANHLHPRPAGQNEDEWVPTRTQWDRIALDLGAEGTLLWRLRNGEFPHPNRLFVLFVALGIPLGVLRIPDRQSVAARAVRLTVTAIRRDRQGATGIDDITPEDYVVVRHIWTHRHAGTLLRHLANLRHRGPLAQEVLDMIDDIVKEWSRTERPSARPAAERVRTVAADWLSPYTLYRFVVPGGRIQGLIHDQ